MISRDERFQDQPKYKDRVEVIQNKQARIRNGKFRPEDFTRAEEANKGGCPAGLCAVRVQAAVLKDSGEDGGDAGVPVSKRPTLTLTVYGCDVGS